MGRSPGIFSFDTYLAPFVKADNLSYPEVKKCIESFIYGVNTPSRWGTQAPFSNITLDWTVPDDMAEMNAIVGGRETDFKYKDCKKEMDLINKAFIETMIEGDANGRGFQYPIPTYSITNEFDWSDTENNRLLFEMTSKYGTPYFSNYINSDMQPSDVRSMCCRLRLDLRELRKKTGGFFGSGESTGSVGVVTINMPRIAYQAKDEADFYARLDHMMDVSARSLKTKRQVITKLLNQGLYPYTKRYLGTFENHFSTIGLIGMNEAGLNARWVRKDMTHRECQEFTKNVLNHMRERLSDYQELYGDLYNLEATPAESTTYRLAKHDKQRYPDIITAGEEGDTPYYTNSSHLPVDYTEDVFDALDIQDELQTLYTSGTVFHAFLGEKMPDWKAAANLVRTVAENYKLPYYTLSPTYSICKCHGYLIGEHFTCPICGEKAEVYSRITGYYRPVQNWNDGKAQEYKNRTLYDVVHSSLKKVHTSVVTMTEDDVKVQPVETHKYLFTTSTCPNCRMAKKMLEGEELEIIDAEQNPDMARQFGIMQAPTLVITDGEHLEKICKCIQHTEVCGRGALMYRIFLAEDDEMLCSLITKHLESWGYQVTAAEDFRDIMGEFVRSEAHLVLLDLKLPYFNGFHWCQRIREFSKVPIIFLSSASDNMNIVMAMNMGGDDFIEKPFDLNVLTAKIQALLRRSYSFQGNVNVIEHQGLLLNLSDATVLYEEKRLIDEK